MAAGKDQFKSSYGSFTARERELERNRARRDARDEGDATPDAPKPEEQPTPSADRPSQ